MLHEFLRAKISHHQYTKYYTCKTLTQIYDIQSFHIFQHSGYVSRQNVFSLEKRTKKFKKKILILTRSVNIGLNSKLTD